MKLHIDFETFSRCELKSAGLHNYALHPTTGVHCMAWAFDGGGNKGLWTPQCADIEEVLSHVRDGGVVVGHNVYFEVAIWNGVCVPRYNWPELKIDQCECTMVRAYAMSFPGALEKLAPAVGVEQRKDSAGSRVMLQLAKPNTKDELWKPEDSPDKFEKLYQYCVTDVEVEMAVDRKLLQLPAFERKVWFLDHKINCRGVRIDLDAVNRAIDLVEGEKNRIDTTINAITDGVVCGATDLSQMRAWLREQGVELAGLAKAQVTDLLAGPLPPKARRVLELRREAAKTSTAKLTAMRRAVSSDGRVMGTMQYHGAGTGRWAGRKVQVHNFPRGFLKPNQVEDAVANFHNPAYLDVMYGSPLDVVSSCLRAMIIPSEGKEFIGCDFSNIEGRVLAWLAGEEWKIQAFRDFDRGVGEDLYILTYAKSFGVSVEEAQPHRQIGKVQELALGYQGGVGAFQTMAKAYGVTVTDERADELKFLWRDAHPATKSYWNTLETMAALAVLHPGQQFQAGPKGRHVTFLAKGELLLCRLPSGRVMFYPYPRVEQTMNAWGKVKNELYYYTENMTTHKWEETSTYGGCLAENVTQAVARDILAAALVRLDAKGADIVMHVHDEIVLEVEGDEFTVKQIVDEMCVLPSWAEGLPIAAKGWRGKRYRKD